MTLSEIAVTDQKLRTQLHNEVISSASDGLITYTDETGFKKENTQKPMFFFRFVRILNKLSKFLNISWTYGNKITNLIDQSCKAQCKLVELNVHIIDKHKSKNYIYSSYLDKKQINSLAHDVTPRLPFIQLEEAMNEPEEAMIQLNAEANDDNDNNPEMQDNSNIKVTPSQKTVTQDLILINDNIRPESVASKSANTKNKPSKLEITEKPAISDDNEMDKELFKKASFLLSDAIKKGVFKITSKDEINSFQENERDMISQESLREYKEGELLSYKNISGTTNTLSIESIVGLLENKSGIFTCPMDKKELFKINLATGKITDLSKCKTSSLPSETGNFYYSNGTLDYYQADYNLRVPLSDTLEWFSEISTRRREINRSLIQISATLAMMRLQLDLQEHFNS